MQPLLFKRKRSTNEFFRFIVQVGFYSCLILTGYMIGISLPNGDKTTDNISIYNNIEINKDQVNREQLHYKTTRKVKVLCYIVTSPTFLWTRAFHVKQTWGSRCDKTLYFSSVTNKYFPRSTCRLQQDGGLNVKSKFCKFRVVIKGDSFITMGEKYFHCFDPASHLTGNYPSWYLRYDAGGALKGKKYMSKNAISFHYVRPEAMYAYDYFLYHVKINE
ncbi:glycoprotein-N-acetylgalactosamine 3-beta-galactosyltransferase 1-like [Ruditapes philippinarum]|uniref:glycoprotein-N-acetylgalactosamine 3-beta-galactosyltransferase 1-like n=1 Tax=Ruditapes philippinarum TaxID=129788 RepID=UPI00295A7D10|nr:glycoprotein-N-acetylgalactosamine 3-beta-galactosyltransferase 1-like [Ruditapes philippinarum]